MAQRIGTGHRFDLSRTEDPFSEIFGVLINILEIAKKSDHNRKTEYARDE